MTENLAPTMSETFEPVDFSNVHEGDRVQFVTANNGFGGSGDDVWRTGTVAKVTEKTVRVVCDDVSTRVKRDVAVLRRADWHYRCVSKAVTEQATRRPYGAEHVQIVDQGLVMTALYIPDPEQAKDPEYVLEHILDRRYENVEVVATATRHFKSEGAAVSGWVIASGNDYGSEGYPNKRALREALDITIADYFTR